MAMVLQNIIQHFVSIFFQKFSESLNLFDMFYYFSHQYFTTNISDLFSKIYSCNMKRRVDIVAGSCTDQYFNNISDVIHEVTIVMYVIAHDNSVTYHNVHSLQT